MRLFYATIAAAVFFVASLPAFAQRDQDKLDALFDAMGLAEMIEILRAEGLVHGSEVAQQMLPGGREARWDALVSDIYDPQVMYEEVRAAFDEELAGDDVDAMLGFFQSETGRTIVSLETSARRAFLDQAVEEASKEQAALAAADKTDRFQQVTRFIETGDLIEANIVGAMNSNYAFLSGLIDGGAMPEGLTAETALQQVWQQEAEIRATTREWLYAYLMLAFQPLSEEELEAYITFTASPAGQDLNNALFVAFDGMFDDVSRALGLGASRFVISREL
ncbi:DUF2059 domain-containing protein [Yoonia sediminilitoris]|uniref:Uncharacterized protein DUF2059 n=1 Tax=Yoonia sediminilitoris TaxID=1286148 RepID=A0A2T6KCM2_9RHOB|nr:DUF2059 domain-containing protein [Yoonia sediminilitoris]PUB12697.1 uncharacterized protein DUF2059 [Yoonia sediminilitoris]RCW94176.1 uncharacterized protein DUF2059 [Yoonia sediminilitoris]